VETLARSGNSLADLDRNRRALKVVFGIHGTHPSSEATALCVVTSMFIRFRILGLHAI
jgi:hypothetical protein